MGSAQDLNAALFRGLKALAGSTFPKQCANCGAIYDSEADFLKKTESIQGQSGLKKSLGDDDRPIVELFRNCPCGSTLMEFFDDRRDTSEKGLKRRTLFGQLLKMLVSKGVSPEVARIELLKVIHGEKSKVLAKLGIDTQVR